MHGNEVLNLGSFTLLPQHVVRLILAREQMKADEFSKFQVWLHLLRARPPYLQAALMWSKRHSWTTKEPLTEVLNPFLVFIKFHMIPARILMSEIHPLGIIPYR